MQESGSKGASVSHMDKALPPWLAGFHDRPGFKGVNEQKCQSIEARLLPGLVCFLDISHLHHFKPDVSSRTN